MKIAIIQFPGSNCERETMLAVQRAEMKPIPFLWNEPTKKLKTCDGYIIIGGFSYEDRGRAGLIASLDPVVKVLAKFAKTGKPILGICNGAQVLVESGLVPGVKDNKVAMALTTNKRMEHGHILGVGFYNDWVDVKVTKPYPNNAFLRHLTPEQPLHIPSAHAEGRFVLASGLLAKLQKRNIGMLQYDGFNPNGSEYDLAAVSNVSGNVMAIMPHPERTPNGDAIFTSMRDYIKEGKYKAAKPLTLKLPKTKLTTYKSPKNTMELIVDLIITDNTAVSIQGALQNLGINANISRQTHWEVQYQKNPKQAKQEIITSCELFNPNKEKLITTVGANNDSPAHKQISILVQDRDNLIGQHKYEILRDSFGIKDIDAIKQGTLWHITANKNIDKTIEIIMGKHILFNPFVHDVFMYTYRRKS